MAQHKDDCYEKPGASGSFLSSLGVLYALLLTVMGIVLPLTVILPKLYGPSSSYLSIFYCYTYGLSIVIFIYLYVYLLRHKRHLHARHHPHHHQQGTKWRTPTGEEDGRLAGAGSSSSSRRGKLDALRRQWHKYRPVRRNEQPVESLDTKPTATDGNDSGSQLSHRMVSKSSADKIANAGDTGGGATGETGGGIGMRGGTADIGSQTDLVEGNWEDDPPFTYNAEGVNFFLLLGLLGFGMGGLANDSFQLSQFMEKTETWECYTIWYILQTVCRLLFIIIQAHFLFKNHKLVINFHKPVVRLALIHLMATNIVDWSYTVTLEATESFLHAMHDMTHEAPPPAPPPGDMGGGAADNTTYTTASGADSVTLAVSGHADDHHMSFETCLSPITLALKLAPYLYPCLIEYSLISAAMLYRLYTNIGEHVEPEIHVKHKSNGATCDKATTGLFAGLIVFVTVCVSVCFFEFYFTTHPLESPVTVHLYYISDSLVHVLAIAACAVAFFKVTGLEFYPHVDNELDRNLILVALAGYYMMALSMILPPFMYVTDDSALMRMFAVYGIVYGFLTIIQVTLQVAFMMDAAQRRTVKLGHYKKKPGRGTVTFLLLCNLSMWVINTFELKAAPYSLVHREYYGLLPWIIIMHLCLPLTIFFRFHSSIMLADVWLESYSSKHVDFEHIRDADSKSKV